MSLIYFAALILLVVIYSGILLMKCHIKKITKPYTILTIIDDLKFIIPTPTLELIDKGTYGNAEEIRSNLLSIALEAYNSGWKNDHDEPYVILYIILVDDSYKVRCKPFRCCDDEI